MTDTELKQTPPEPAAPDTGAAAGAPGAAEAAAPEIALPSPDEQLAELRDENAKLREEADKLRDQLLRALAEAENIRRRGEREKEDTAKYAISRFAKDLLDVADNLNRALASVPAETLEGNEAASQLAIGVGLTEKQLLAAFERHGIQRLDPVDQKFDPNYHEAVFEVPNSGKLPGTVVQVMQPGYVLHGRLLRPAMVGVAKGEPPQKIDTLA